MTWNFRRSRMQRQRRDEARSVQETVLRRSVLIISPQGRVTDHRINLTLYKLDKILNGDIQEIIDACIAGPGEETCKNAG